MKITFLGVTSAVTGSKYLIQAEHKNVLVDCGLFQGYKELRLRNWHSFILKAHPNTDTEKHQSLCYLLIAKFYERWMILI